MNEIKNILKSYAIIYKLWYGLRLDVLHCRISKDWKKSVEVACNNFLSIEELGNESLLKSIHEDIFNSYKLIKSSPFEYFLFGLRNLPDKQKKTFLSDVVMNCELSKRGYKKLFNELSDKYNFYEHTKKYFKRRVFRVNNQISQSLFTSKIKGLSKVICKPNHSSCGGGIFIYSVTEKSDIDDLYNELINKGGDWIIEEVIIQSNEMAMWNESSVNTIRVPALYSHNGFSVITPFFRVGRKGKIVDNAGSGGLFANIDKSTGVIYTDAIDEQGHYYTKHPDSGRTFKGYQIPQWNELMKLVLDVHTKCMPQHRYIGWDFALSDKGWVLIEGNWGQFVNQYNDKVGCKYDFLKFIKDK